LESSIFFGGSVLAAFIAGGIALFAPCCISVMLPAYFASSFQNRSLLVAMTFLFMAGIATVILPIALGASALRQLITDQHTVIYLVGGLLMLALGAYVLLGGQLHLPMPGRRAGAAAGPWSVYSLGVFSGVASSCCAPVLAGVIALSSATSSFTMALGLGSAYVFGMVGPLFVISLLWDRYDWRSSRLFRPRSVTWRLGPLKRTITVTGLATALLLLAIGIGMVWLGLSGDGMAAAGGWQAELFLTLQYYGKIATDLLSWLPAWAAAVLLVALAAWLAWLAMKQLGAGRTQDVAAVEDTIAGSEEFQRE
jgi:cytochrome c-type biogenesis protein